MKERLINFTPEMVLAILDGRKTMTRHPCDIKPLEGTFNGYQKDAMDAACRNHCPLGWIGDILWVRESYYQFGHWEPIADTLTRTGRQKWKFVPDGGYILYEPSGPLDVRGDFRKGMHKGDPATPAWHKRLGRFMPRKYARIWLEITAVRVERVQDISEEDAKAEGVRNYEDDKYAGSCRLCEGDGYYLRNDGEEVDCHACDTYAKRFAFLWDSIYAERGLGWAANPWVWAITFNIKERK